MSSQRIKRRKMNKGREKFNATVNVQEITTEKTGKSGKISIEEVIEIIFGDRGPEADDSVWRGRYIEYDCELFEDLTEVG